MSYDSAAAVIESNPRVVFATSVRPITSRGHVALPDLLADLVTRTATDNKPTALVSFGSPYLMSQVPSYTGVFLLAWNAIAANERAVANALAGGAPITGKLPITLSDRFGRGHGIIMEAR
jgi:beta-N-acetylhexosaminidase